MAHLSNREGQRRASRGAVWAFVFFLAAGLRAGPFLFQLPNGFWENLPSGFHHPPAGPVVFQLRNGDRVAGTILSEGTNAVVISTPWAKELAIPLEHIESCSPLVTVSATNVPVTPPAATLRATTAAPTNNPVVAGAVPTIMQPLAIQPRPPKEWRADVKMGVDLIYGSKDRQLYYGQFALTYAKPQTANPSKFLRNILEYRVDYAETDGVESANRMFGANKTDWDIGRSTFVYNFMGVGYDEVRKIDLQYEVGPGFGYHLLRRTNFVANIEGGLTYQSQERVDSPTVESLYARIGEDFTWKIVQRVTLTQRATLLTQVDDLEQMQLRMEANLSLGIVKSLSFNLTVIELYDTQPVSGVSRNEFQLRSSIGLAF